MTGGQFLALLVAAGIVTVLVRAAGRSKRRWPQIACATCDGAGWVIRRIVVGMRLRKVRRPCKTCGGVPWSER